MDPLSPQDLKGRRVLVLGLGAFGGGVGATRALLQLGAEVTASDLRPATALPEAMAALEPLAAQGAPLRFALGGHQRELFEEAEVVVVNPAVPATSPWLAVARELGCRLTTEVNLALALAPARPTVAITGTHGKSTCAALCAHLLQELPGPTILGGNLGGSLLEQLLPLPPQARLVLELSSFQAERLLAPPGWPKVAILTSFGPDHLDRHGDLATYAACKRRLLLAQQADAMLLLPPPSGDPLQDQEVERWEREARGKVQRLRPDGYTAFGLTPADLPFNEPYRMPSLLAALHAARLLGSSDASIRAGTRDFSGLPHRMQRLVRRDGRVVLDNGIATHPAPTAAALRHLPPDTILLAGGKDKGLDLSEVLGTFHAETRLFLHGAGGQRLAEEARAAGHSALLVHHFDHARAAFRAALDAQQSAQILLFSPTFSSYDEFRNFSERAQCFHSIGDFLPVDKKEAQAPTCHDLGVTTEES